MVQYTIGIAGHIDHGKTTLTKALTGLETDRLKEEQERQISIETGFAHFRLPHGQIVGVVDVPGHERFIRQMIAGVAGIDLVLLVVAANEGVMPQTREHLDILNLLGVKKGIVVLTKSDLVDEEFLALVTEEIREITSNTFMEHAPIRAISAKSGLGIATLVDEITRSLAMTPVREQEEHFRLPIDRAFTVKGTGTVITGTVFEGKVAVGDTLRLLPQDQLVRVRGMQAYHSRSDIAYAGQRVAINIAGIEHDQLNRGDALVAPQFLEPTQRVDIQVRLLASIEKPLKHRSRLSVYTGTAEIEGMILFFDRSELLPGESTYAQILLEQAIVVRRDDPILLRRPTPALTLGGGRIVHPYGVKLPYRIESKMLIQRLHQATVSERILMALATKEKSLEQIQNELTIHWQELEPFVVQLLDQGELIKITNDAKGVLHYIFASSKFLLDAKDRLLMLLNDYHRSNPMQQGMKRSECKEQLQEWSDVLFTWVIEQLKALGQLRMVGERLVHASFLPTLPPHLQRPAKLLLEQLVREGREVSDWQALAAHVGLNPKQAEEVKRFYVEQGEIINMSEKWVWPYATWESSVALLREQRIATLNIATVKDLLGLSRKYIIPFLEMMDQAGLTKREGDQRVWRSSEVISEA